MFNGILFVVSSCALIAFNCTLTHSISQSYDVSSCLTNKPNGQLNTPEKLPTRKRERYAQPPRGANVFALAQ